MKLVWIQAVTQTVAYCTTDQLTWGKGSIAFAPSVCTIEHIAAVSNSVPQKARVFVTVSYIQLSLARLEAIMGLTMSS
jgi:hypothetical protein